MKKDQFHIPIRIAGVADGIHEFALSASPRDLELPEEFTSDFQLSIRMDKTHSQIILTVAASSSVVCPCDRCLEPVAIPIEQRFVLFYARDAAAAKLFDEDDVRVIDPNESMIDISGDVRDYALLTIPMRRTCGEDGEGNPLCKPALLESVLDHGGNGIDPRWEKLKSIERNSELDSNK
jgi:uncharacterized metal-binding protein YceD (DUF177 family)